MHILKKFLSYLVCAVVLFAPSVAFADMPIVDNFNLAPVVPIVLDAFMAVATAGYEFFVGNGNGIIYLLVWGFLVISLSLYLLKMFFPKTWISVFGFSGGGELADGKTSGFDIAKNLLKPGIRAIIAATVLLQLRPVYLTQWLVNPFLQFGAIYTNGITSAINATGVSTRQIECPPDIVAHEWISEDSCRFLIQPVSDLSAANNTMIKRGFEYLDQGLRGLITLIPHGGRDFMNLVTGIILVSTFVASNLFMALLVIQAIFEFGMSLILYPFQVLAYVARQSDKWFDIWPAFSGVTRALQKLVITMIACAFILGINIAIIRSLFSWNRSMFVVAAGGSATSNIPTTMAAGGFGEHSVLWLSSILTFYLMFRIFQLTREQLESYVGSGTDALYNQVTGDTKLMYNKAKNAIDWIKTLRKK